MRKEKWKLTLPLSEARKNEEIISLADSQILRWIDELNGIVDADEKAVAIKREIRRLRKQDISIDNRREIKRLYAELDTIQFKPDYMCLMIDKPKDYHRACEGFSINGVKYVRLLGTNGGIKNSTIVFVSERLAPELRRRIENDRDPDKELVPAKLEAYKALTCSAANPVSFPNGVIVVDDCETEFYDDYIFLTNEGSDEPVMKEMKNQLITIDASDGYGIMLPSLAQRWSDELKLDYMMSGANTRFAWEKGMVFTFDFVDFAEKVAGTYYVKDAWGNIQDVRNAELILTTSMVKLYDSYDSCDSYQNKSIANGYTFGVTKTCPMELENNHTLNYQFIQSFDLDDDDIDELIEPTAREIEDTIYGDWRAAALFLKGSNMTEDNVFRLADDCAKALMIDHNLINDPFIQDNIYQLIKWRINNAKVGVLNVHGNYSMVSGDPYILCQSMFGLEKTGLLKAGEVYNEYWADAGAEEVLCFRAPMSTHANIRKVRPVDNEEVRYWYRYIHTATIINAWDTIMAALNGCDFDGDLVMLTDNPVLLRRHKALPAIMCEQQKAEKKIPTDEDFVKSNIASFGNEIGQITNWITSMYEVQAGYPKDSEEYKTLEYRIMSGQLIQQQSIDKAKGIIARPMPRSWHDRYAVASIEDENKRELYCRISADKKPYFMRYVYHALSKQYNDYIKKTNKVCLRKFNVSIDEFLATSYEELNDEQREFLKYFELQLPTGNNDCVMNKICKKIEQRFDGVLAKQKEVSDYDYAHLKYGCQYNKNHYYAISKLYNEYNNRLRAYKIFEATDKMTSDEMRSRIFLLNEEFDKECSLICQAPEELTDILLDICYQKKNTKRFVWNMCGTEIISNLLEKHRGIITVPILDKEGDFSYSGNRYKIADVIVEE